MDKNFNLWPSKYQVKAFKRYIKLIVLLAIFNFIYDLLAFNAILLIVHFKIQMKT